MIFDTTLDPVTLYDWITRGGLIGLLAFVIVGNYKGWWISKREADEKDRRISYLEHSNRQWMELAFKSTKITEEVTTMVRSDENTL
jgi:hypothetical protein